MTTPRDIGADDLAWVHALNQAHAVELSDMAFDDFAALVGRAAYARVIEPESAFLLAYDRRPHAFSPNFDRFATRFDNFLYVDRIAVAAAHRRRGHARTLYEDLFAFAEAAEFAMVGCEVNSDPPNPASDAFHAALGFEPCGEAFLADRGKTVRYFRRPISGG